MDDEWAELLIEYRVEPMSHSSFRVARIWKENISSWKREMLKTKENSYLSYAVENNTTSSHACKSD